MKLTGSTIGRATKCAASAVLPHSGDTSPAAEWGRVVHEFLANVNEVGREAALELVPEKHREACEAINLRALPVDPKAFASEVAFGYDVESDSARELGRGLGRQYPPLRVCEIPGTADVVGLTPDSVVVLDWKTGFANLGPVQENTQLRFYALAAARAYNRTRATIATIHLREGEEPRWENAELDVVDLEATAAELRSLLKKLELEEARVAKGLPAQTVEGGHCRFCPAFVHCPAKVALASALARPDEAQMPALDAETLPIVLERLEAAEAVLKRVRESVEAYARETPVTLPTGEVYGPVPVARESIDPIVGGQVLADKFGEEVAQEAVETKRTLTKTALQAALRGYAKAHGCKASALEREALDLLRSRGATRKAVTYSLRRYRPALPPGDEAQEKA